MNREELPQLNPNFIEFDKKFQLIDDIREFYGELSNYDHSKGKKFSNFRLNPGTNQCFLEKSFKIVCDYLFRIVKIVTIVLLLQLPEYRKAVPDELLESDSLLFGFLTPAMVDRIKKIVSEEELELLLPSKDLSY